MVVLGIGSNLPSSYGDRFKNIEIAISYLNKYKIEVIKKSSFYETPSYPDITNPKFINVVIEVKTDLNPTELVSVLLFIEDMLQRVRVKKNDPRTCDIDIIDYKQKNMNFKYENLDFVVPHEKLSNRNFVLFPLREILPEWKHPKTNDHIDILIDKLSNVDKKSILKINKS